MGHSKLGLMGWEAGIESHMKGGILAICQKPRGRHSVFANELQETLYFEGWNLAEVGRSGFEVVGGFNRLARGVEGGKDQKLEIKLLGLDFAWTIANSS